VNGKASLRTLPFGLLELNREGIVTEFSPVTESYSDLQARDIIGRDFFAEIVPFAEAKEAEEKFRRFMRRQDSHERLFFTFPSEHGVISVQIALAYLPEKEPARLAIVRLMPESKGDRQ
jgi:photoactive yellow protein